MVYTGTGSSPAFQDQDGARFLLSWFNRRRKTSKTGFTANRSTSSALTWIELNSEIRNSFICWADEGVRFTLTGSAANSADANNYLFSDVAFDGTTPETEGCIAPPFSKGNNPIPIVVPGVKTGLAEGVAHYATWIAAVQANTGTWYAQTSIAAYTTGCQILLEVNG